MKNYATIIATAVLAFSATSAQYEPMEKLPENVAEIEVAGFAAQFHLDESGRSKFRSIYLSYREEAAEIFLVECKLDAALRAENESESVEVTPVMRTYWSRSAELERKRLKDLETVTNKISKELGARIAAQFYLLEKVGYKRGNCAKPTS